MTLSNIWSCHNIEKSRKYQKMERPRNFFELKPFYGETDNQRKFDLLRAVVIFRAVRNHPNKDRGALACKYFDIFMTLN